YAHLSATHKAEAVERLAIAENSPTVFTTPKTAAPSPSGKPKGPAHSFARLTVTPSESPCCSTDTCRMFLAECLLTSKNDRATAHELAHGVANNRVAPSRAVNRRNVERDDAFFLALEIWLATVTSELVFARAAPKQGPRCRVRSDEAAG